MKKIYELKKEDFEREEKEFKKTAYGKKLNELKWSVMIMEIIFMVFMIISEFNHQFEEADLITNIIHDNTLWLGLLISNGFLVLVQMKYIEALKEYILKVKLKD